MSGNYSSYLWNVPVAVGDHTSETTARLLVDSVVCRQLVPGELLSDRRTITCCLVSSLIYASCLECAKLIPWPTTHREMGWLRTSIVLCRWCWANMVHLGNYISSNFCLLIGLDHILLQESHHSISFMGKTQGSQLRPLFKNECVLGGCRELLIGVDTWSGHFLEVGKPESIGKAQKQQKECYDRWAKEMKYQARGRVKVFMSHEKTIVRAGSWHYHITANSGLWKCFQMEFL